MNISYKLFERINSADPDWKGKRERLTYIAGEAKKEYYLAYKRIWTRFGNNFEPVVEGVANPKFYRTLIQNYLDKLTPELNQSDAGRSFYTSQLLYDMRFPQDTGLAILPHSGKVEVLQKRSVYVMQSRGSGSYALDSCVIGSTLGFDVILRRDVASYMAIDIFTNELLHQLWSRLFRSLKPFPQEEARVVGSDGTKYYTPQLVDIAWQAIRKLEVAEWHRMQAMYEENPEAERIRYLEVAQRIACRRADEAFNDMLQSTDEFAEESTFPMPALESTLKKLWDSFRISYLPIKRWLAMYMPDGAFVRTPNLSADIYSCAFLATGDWIVEMRPAFAAVEPRCYARKPEIDKTDASWNIETVRAEGGEKGQEASIFAAAAEVSDRNAPVYRKSWERRNYQFSQIRGVAAGKTEDDVNTGDKGNYTCNTTLASPTYLFKGSWLGTGKPRVTLYPKGILHPNDTVLNRIQCAMSDTKLVLAPIKTKTLNEGKTLWALILPAVTGSARMSPCVESRADIEPNRADSEIKGGGMEEDVVSEIPLFKTHFRTVYPRPEQNALASLTDLLGV